MFAILGATKQSNIYPYPQEIFGNKKSFELNYIKKGKIII